MESLADSLIGVLSEALPYILTILIRQGAKRRAAVAVSGEAAERPMESEAVRASSRVFAVPIFPGQYCRCPVRHVTSYYALSHPRPTSNHLFCALFILQASFPSSEPSIKGYFRTPYRAPPCICYSSVVINHQRPKVL